MNERPASYWIEHLSLLPHPEGGYFREAYRSKEVIAADALPARFGAARTFATSIYYLLGNRDRSAFHRIKSDETWHFYAGQPLELFQLDPSKPDELTRVVIGQDLHAGQHLQWTVPAGVWFGSRPLESQGDIEREPGYSLLGCGVSPGFDFADFQLATRSELTRLFPKHAALIAQLCIE